MSEELERARRDMRAVLEIAERREQARRRRARREKRALAIFALACFIIGMLILAEQARARPPVPAPIYKAIRANWKNPADRRHAFDIVACETGDTYDLDAHNGQYLGIFQMGRHERHVCGHGPTARDQARAARCWYDKTGHDFGAWTCA